MNQQYEKNPNGGYVNKSQYGQDSWYGNIDITPPLLAEIQRTGKVSIQVKDVQVTQYGECRRVVAKPYSPPQQAPATAGHNGYTNAQPAQQYTQQMQAPAPMQPQYAPQAAPQPGPAPVQPGAPMQSDDIPW